MYEAFKHDAVTGQCNNVIGSTSVDFTNKTGCKVLNDVTFREELTLSVEFSNIVCVLSGVDLPFLLDLGEHPYSIK